MFKFVKNCIILLSICGIILCLMNIFYLNSHFYAIKHESTAKFNSLPQRIDYLNVGSSHGERNFFYEHLNNKANLALSSQNFSYDYKILDVYRDIIVPRAVLVIPMSYFSLYWDECDSNFESKNKRYYDFLDEAHITNFDSNYWFVSRAFPLFELSGNELLGILVEQNKGFQNDWQKRADVEFKTLDELKKAGRDKYESHKLLVDDYSKVNDSMDLYLRKILELCEERDWQPVFVTTPYLNEYSSLWEQEFLDKFYNDIAKYSDEYSVPYLDYSKDSGFLFSPELFTDTDHLNIYGAKIFTEIVLDDIDKLEIR